MKKIKSNKGIALTDVAIALIIITIFVGSITAAFYRVYYNVMMSRADALAVNYAVNIAEKIDEISYEEVSTENVNDIISSVQEKVVVPEGYNAEITVENLIDIDATKKDIIKKVQIKVSYEYLEELKSYTIKKLKIKE